MDRSETVCAPAILVVAATGRAGELVPTFDQTCATQHGAFKLQRSVAGWAAELQRRRIRPLRDVCTWTLT